MRNLITAAAVAAVTFAAGSFAVGASPLAARAATVAPAHSVNWTEATCHAFAEWERHQDATDFYRLITSAAHLRKSYLKADVLELAADVSSPSKSAADAIDVAIQYAGEDCWGGA